MANRGVTYISRAILCSCVLALPWPVNIAGARDAPPAATTEFIEQLKNGSFDTGQSGAMKRVPLDPKAQAAAVPLLIEMLPSADPGLAQAAAEALGNFGAAAAPAVPSLEEVVSVEREGPLRAAATVALARINAAMERARFQVRFEDDLLTVGADEAILGDVVKEISRQAHIAVVFGAGVEKQRVSAEFADRSLDEGLRHILAEYDVFTYHRGGKGLLTVWVYGKLEGRGLYPIPFESWASTADLARRLDDVDAAERAAAIETLVERGGADAELQVIRALGDGDERVRTTALYQALEEGVALSPETLSDLAINDSSYKVRFLALKGLAGDPTEEWIAEAALSDPNAVVRKYAESILNRLYPPEGSQESGQQTQNSSP